MQRILQLQHLFPSLRVDIIIYYNIKIPPSLEVSIHLLLALLLSPLLQLLPLPLSSNDVSLSIPQQCNQIVLLYSIRSNLRIVLAVFCLGSIL